MLCWSVLVLTSTRDTRREVGASSESVARTLTCWPGGLRIEVPWEEGMTWPPRLLDHLIGPQQE